MPVCIFYVLAMCASLCFLSVCLSSGFMSRPISLCIYMHSTQSHDATCSAERTRIVKTQKTVNLPTHCHGGFGNETFPIRTPKCEEPSGSRRLTSMCGHDRNCQKLWRMKRGTVRKQLQRRTSCRRHCSSISLPRRKSARLGRKRSSCRRQAADCTCQKVTPRGRRTEPRRRKLLSRSSSR